LYEDSNKFNITKFSMAQIHFIAIGGAVMHQLAIALLKKGNTVTGSDDEINDPASTNLRLAGILPTQNGWFPEKIHSGIDAIVLGMHARADNPELLEAQKLGLKIYSFPEYIYEVSKQKTRVVVAGSHGKTTITSMIMHILKHQGIAFDYMVGAKVSGFDLSVQLSDAPIIILEGDEYPASVIEKRPKFFFYHPNISVLSGIAWDHINVFPTYDIYLNQFQQYLSGMQAGATLYYNEEDAEVNSVVNSAATHLNAVPYKMPVYQYYNGQAIVQTPNGHAKLSVFGNHNLLNLQAAVAVCAQLGVNSSDAYAAIASFTGAAKRLEKIIDDNDLLVYRDFAHAPSKLKATLNAVREAFPDHKLIACFELHTFSSLNEAFLNEYAHSMDSADVPLVYFSHHALQLKGLPSLLPETVRSYFANNALTVVDDKIKLELLIKGAIQHKTQPVLLLLMSSGTFDGIDWNVVCSQRD
jgi:UDP-N-acetylmuramate: L-alanyl-gamma-D-glutamyl-meso-diaminopimelate ligase